ncbi:sec14l1, partial [Symbiodinium pilosum]
MKASAKKPLPLNSKNAQNLSAANIDFYILSAMVFGIGLAMFLCPIVPGSAVYLFAGVVLGAQSQLPGRPGFIVGIAAGVVASSVAKHVACVGQYLIGYYAGKFVKVQQMVGVDQVPTRATEKILKTPGLGLGKVCILIAGPDFPTSVLCGILKLNIPQMLLGTTPIVLVSIIPQVTVGALLTYQAPEDNESSSNIQSMISNIVTGFAAAIQASAMLLFTWRIMKTVEQDGEELAKPRPEHAAVAQLTAQEAAYTAAFKEVSRWQAMSCAQASVLLLAVASIVFSGFVIAADFMLTEKFCFRNFAITNKISDAIDLGGLDNNAWNIAACLQQMVCQIIFGKMISGAARAFRSTALKSNATPILLGQMFSDAQSQTCHVAFVQLDVKKDAAIMLLMRLLLTCGAMPKQHKDGRGKGLPDHDHVHAMTTSSWFDWLNCCGDRETAEVADSSESLTALAREGEEAAEWQIVQRGVEHAEFLRLLQLRSRLRDCDDHPACREQVLSRQPQTLLRFLRARNGDLQKAEVMFKAMLEWRHAFGVDEKVQQWRTELEKQSTQRSIQMRRFETDVELCRDRYGVPVRLIRTSVADVQGLVREFGKDLVLIDTIMRMERTHEEIRRSMFDREELIAGQLQIIDMGDYGRHGVPNLTSRLFSSLKLAAEISQITDANYPETVRKAFIIRLGSCTSTAWRYCIQPLLPERTQNKLVPCGPK